MEPTSINSQPRSVTGRGWFYRLFRKWRMRHYLKLSRKLKSTQRALAAANKQIIAKDKEVDRLTKLAELWRRKCEIQMHENYDRLLEMNRSIGTRFATTDIEEQIHTLDDQPFVEKKRKKIEEDGLEFTLEGDELDAYNERYDNHRKFAHSQNIYDEAAIKRTWDQHKDDEIAEIRASIMN